MPQSASTLDAASHLCLMIVAGAKLGKTQSVGQSLVAAFGAGYIIQCGTKTSMAPLRRVTEKFEFDIIRDENSMEQAIREARKGVKENRYKWIFLDDFNLYTSWLLKALEDQTRNAKGESDGRKFWPAWYDRVGNTLARLSDVPTHFVMSCHPDSFSGRMKGEIPGVFDDVIVLENIKGKREFILNGEDAPGHACRSISGEMRVAADCGALWKLFRENSRKKR